MAKILTYPLDQFVSFKELNTEMPQSIQVYNKKRKIIRDVQQTSWRHYDPKPKNPLRYNQPDDEKLYDSIRSKLNKLTNDNIDDVIKELLELSITSKEHLDELTNIIILKAMTERMFSELYVKICSEYTPYFIIAKTEKISFKSVLISKCQEIYMKCINSECELLDKQRIGFISFLGQLYVGGVITLSIIESCLNELIRKYKQIPEGITLAVILMNTVKTKIMKTDIEKYNKYVDTFEKIISSGVSLKDKFKIQDMLEGKELRW